MPASPEARLRNPPAETPVFLWPTPNKTDLLFYEEHDGNLPKNQQWKPGDPHRDIVRFPHHKLVYVSPQDATNWSKWWYAADRCHQDLYNYQWTSTEIGSREFESVTRSYLIPRCEFVAGTLGYLESNVGTDDANLIPAPGTPMPLVPESVFSGYTAGDYVAAHAKQARAPQELDSLYVALDVVFVKRCSTVSLGYDDATSGILTKTSTIYYRTEVVVTQYGIDRTAEWLFSNPENEFWGLSVDGYVTSGAKLSCDWYVIDEQQQVPSGGDSSSGGSPSPYGKLIRSYWTNDNMVWPAIFRDGDFSLKPITKFVDKTRTKVYTRVFPRVELANPRFDGPTKVFVSEYWSKNPVTLPELDVLMPKAIDYNGAQFNLTVQPTLHENFIITDSIGTEDPEYAIGEYGETFNATAVTEWPATMTVKADQKPFRGGYLIEIAVAYRPSCYVAP